MSTFRTLMDEDQRFFILLSLVQMGYDGNASMLTTALDAYGHRVSATKMAEHLSWLNICGLVELSEIGSMTKAVLTQKGQDVAEGRETIAGVRRPKAGEL